MNLRNIDLNLLVLFDVLMKEKNISHAARKIGLSQSAMSNALNRLRDLFEDPILVRTGTRMVPTQKAQTLVKPIQDILSRITMALATKPTFTPDQSEKKFVILTTDYGEVVILPHLIARIKKEAPNIRIETKRLERGASVAQIYNKLEERHLDLVILSFTPETKGFSHSHLFSDNLVTIARNNHPLTKNGLDKSGFFNSQHLSINLRDDKTYALEDTVFNRLKTERKIAVTIPHYMAAPWLIVNSDLMVTVPGKIGRIFKKTMPLDIFHCPVHPKDFKVNMIWHNRFDTDPSHKWLRDILIGLKPLLK